MIYQLFSDLRSFKKISFQPGMNIIVANKDPQSTYQDTRNKTGKTSFVELINFLLGSTCDETCIFKKEELKQYNFYFEFDLKGVKTIIERNGEDANKIFITNENDNPSYPLINEKFQVIGLSLTEWRNKLGFYLFDIDPSIKKRKMDKFRPTFRSLFSYFSRRENEGGIVVHERQSKDQQIWDQQVAISFLLGLDWTISQDWQYVREREKTLKQLKKAASEGLFGEIIGSVASLRTSLAISEEKLGKMEYDLKSFKILPEYDDYERTAAQLTKELANIANENTLDRELIDELKTALISEIPPSYDNLKMVYQETGIIFPNNIYRRFEDLQKFHDGIIQNRESYLQSEINDAEVRIRERNKIKENKITRRAQIMSILNSHGAFDQFSRIQSDLIGLRNETEALRQKYQAAEQLESKKIELNIERNKLLIRLQQNFFEQTQLMNHIIVTFESISRRLYKDPGRLEITGSIDGPQFDIKIQGDKSKGIRNMQIFCFDMMLMILCKEKGIGPDFLIHDSHVFDGVDENQIATAFQIGAEMAQKHNFQYIVTINSCDMPSKFASNFNINNYILPVGITDAKDNGGLFGFTF